MERRQFRCTERERGVKARRALYEVERARVWDERGVRWVVAHEVVRDDDSNGEGLREGRRRPSGDLGDVKWEVRAR